jgi:tail tape-measure protein
MATDITTLGMEVDSSGVRKASDELDKMTGAGSRAEKSATDFEASMRRASAEGEVLGRAIAEAIVKVFELSAAFVRLGLNVGRYQDIAEKTQSDPAGLASFRTSADVAGTSVDAVGQAINRMTLQLSKGADESKGAAKALNALNIDAERFKSLRPEDQFRSVAKALEGYADGQEKVTALQLLMGRGGADQLVIMKELAKAQEPLVRLTNQQIAYADDLSDSISRNRSELQQAAEVMALGTLPALEAVTASLRDAALEAIGFDEATGEFDAEKLQEFAFDVAQIFAFMADSARGSAAAVLVAAKTLGAGAAQLREFFFSSGMTAEGKDRAIENIKEIGRAWEEDVGGVLGGLVNGKTMQDRVEEQIAAIRARVAAAKREPTTGDFSRLDRGTKPRIEGLEAEGAEVKKAAASYDQLMAKVRGFSAEQRAEAAASEKLTAGQRLAVATREQLSASTSKLGAAQRASVEAALSEALAAEKSAIAMEKRRKALEDANKLAVRMTEEAARHAVSMEDAAKAAEREAENVGKTAAELADLESARLRDEAALLRSQAATAGAEGLGSQYNQMLLRQADALDRAAAAGLRKATLEQNSETQRRANEAAQTSLDQAKELARSALLEAEAFGKTSRELEALETSRLRDLAASLRMQVALENGEGLGRQYNDMLLRQAEALETAAAARERRAAAEKAHAEDAYAGASRALRKYVEETREAGIETEISTTRVIRSAEDALVDLRKGGENSVKRLVDTMLDEFLRLRIVKPFLAEIFGSAGSAGGGGGGDFFGQLIKLFVGGFTGSGGSEGTTGDFSRLDRGQGQASPSSQTRSFQQSLTINIDSRSDQTQVAQMVATGVAEGQRQYTEQLRAAGVI